MFFFLCILVTDLFPLLKFTETLIKRLCNLLLLFPVSTVGFLQVTTDISLVLVLLRMVPSIASCYFFNTILFLVNYFLMVEKFLYGYARQKDAHPS